MIFSIFRNSTIHSVSAKKEKEKTAFGAKFFQLSLFSKVYDNMMAYCIVQLKTVSNFVT